MKLSTGAICGAALFAFGLVLPSWLIFFAAGGSFQGDRGPGVAVLGWIASWFAILIGAIIGAAVAEELEDE